MPPRLTVAPPWGNFVHAHFVWPVRSWPSMSSDDLDDPDLEDDDPYIAFRNARGSLGRWAPRMGGTRWMASDPGGRLAGAEELLASGAPPIILDNGMKVRVDGRLGEGRFGDVLLGKADDGSSVAIKVALRRTSQLATEAACLRAVAGSAGFPRLLAHRTPSEERASELLVMELLGDSVQTLWERASRRTHFSSPTVRHIGRGTLRCLRALHRAGYVHNDLKPPNVLLGAASSAAADEMHLIDFGLATTANAAAAAGAPSSPKAARGSIDARVGSPLFASVAAHDGFPTRPVDDLESLVYMLAFLAAGSLPWQQAAYARVPEMKRALLRDGCAALVDSIASSRDIARDSVSSAQAREHTVDRSSTADMAQALRGLWTEVTAAQQADNIDHVYEACLAALEEKADAPESTDVGHAYDWHTAA